MLTSLKGVITAAIAIASLVPGASLIVGLVDLPPDFNDLIAFGTAFLGPVVVLITVLSRNALFALPTAIKISLIAISLIGGVVMSWTAYEFSVKQIGEVTYLNDKGEKEVERYVQPEKLSDDLEYYINQKYGGYWSEAIISNQDGEDIRNLIRVESLPSVGTGKVFQPRVLE